MLQSRPGLSEVRIERAGQFEKPKDPGLQSDRGFEGIFVKSEFRLESRGLDMSELLS